MTPKEWLENDEVFCKMLNMKTEHPQGQAWYAEGYLIMVMEAYAQHICTKLADMVEEQKERLKELASECSYKDHQIAKLKSTLQLIHTIILNKDLQIQVYKSASNMQEVEKLIDQITQEK